MSQAFVREADVQWLHDVAPAVQALLLFLTRENNGIRVYEKGRGLDKKTGGEVIYMSNGLGYSKDADGRWMAV